jgi:hypothetical protein
MNDQTITADEVPAQPEERELQIDLPAAVDQGVRSSRIEDQRCQASGMRNKPVPLARVPWEDIVQMNQHTRGLPDPYAMEFRRHVIRVWPASVHQLTLIVGMPSGELEG